MKQSIKTKITVVLAIIIYILLMMLTLMAVTPEGEFDVERLARDAQGNIYAACVSDDEVLICRLDVDGNADRYYRCRREARDAQILCGYFGGKIYISQLWHEEGDQGHAVGAGQHFSIWETAGRGFRCILQGTIDSDTMFTDIRVDWDGVYLAGIDLQTQQVLVYRYQEDELLVQRYVTDFVPLTVCFGRKGMYMLSDDNRMYVIEEDGNGSIPVRSELGDAAVIFTDDDGVYWQSVGSRDIKYLLYEGVEGYVFRDVGYVQDIAYAVSVQNSAMILQEDGENRLLVIGQDGEDGYYLDAVGLQPIAVGQNALVPMLMVTLVYIAVCAVLTGMILFLRNKSRLLYRTLAAIGGLSGICLVVMIVVVNFHESGSYSGTNLAVIAFAEWLVVMIITMLFLGHIWKNMDIVLTWMDKISRGEYDIESRKAPDDEFGMMWTALERTCRNLRVQKYRYHEAEDYLYRYAPRNFEQLFDKENLQEVGVGETRQLPVTLGMISVIDKEALLAGRTQKQYMQYANKLMDILFSQREAEQAVFLQDGNTLENVKVVFKGSEESAPAALQYSAACLETLMLRTDVRYDTTPFFLLHTAEVSCGLSGGNRQVYPYVTSLEMETLGGYAGRLRACGARIVVTESTWQLVQEQAEGRYIGYVASAGQGAVFRLYEIFDAYPQPQKLERRRNRGRFEQALELFYQDDLYQARSAFADVLRECPDDGICGWYVSACDALFNGGETADRRHDLFGDFFER